jgi:hypothetical protein
MSNKIIIRWFKESVLFLVDSFIREFVFYTGHFDIVLLEIIIISYFKHVVHINTSFTSHLFLNHISVGSPSLLLYDKSCRLYSVLKSMQFSSTGMSSFM